MSMKQNDEFEESKREAENAFKSPDYYMAILPPSIKSRAASLEKEDGTELHWDGNQTYYLTVKFKPNSMWFVGYTFLTSAGDTAVWKFAEAKTLNDAFHDMEEWLAVNGYATSL